MLDQCIMLMFCVCCIIPQSDLAIYRGKRLTFRIGRGDFRNERVTVLRAQFMILATIEAEALHRSFFDDLFGHQKLINGLGLGATVF